MNYLRLGLFFVISLLLVTLVMSWLMPVKQHLEKSITIQAPAAAVYEELVLLKNFNAWSVWNQHDSTVKNTITGTDGNTGARSDWKGDPSVSGEGSIELTTAIANSQVHHTIRFHRPKAMTARSVFTLTEANGLTTVSWYFEIDTPRPWNIFNLFSDLDKQLGEDFEKGLQALKERVAQKNPAIGQQTGYEIKEMDFPETNYAVIRQVVHAREVPTFLSLHFPLIAQEAKRRQTEVNVATGLFFTVDNAGQRVDLAAAFPLPDDKELGSAIIKMEKIKAGRAVYTDHYGAPDKTALALTALRQYVAAKKWTEKSPVIEQYLTDPALEKDTSKWQTRVLLLLKE